MRVSSVTVVVLQYSQSKSWLPDALMHSPDLQKERQGLVEAGLSSALPSGAKIFVAPEVFTAIVQYFEDEGWDLKTSHVIVPPSLDQTRRPSSGRGQSTVFGTGPAGLWAPATSSGCLLPVYDLRGHDDDMMGTTNKKQ